MNKDKYKYIAIYDFDELIFPRSPINSLINESLYISYERSKPLMPYFESLQVKKKKYNMRFKMSVYLKHESMRILFTHLEKMFKQNLNTLYINQYEIFEKFEQSANFKKNYFITIETEQDYGNAKHLYKMHKKYIEPFLKENYVKILLSSIPDIFNRFYYCGLYVIITVHYTNQKKVLEQHRPKGISMNESIIVPTSLGFVSHFREKYKRPFKNYSIQESLFDFNYFIKRIIILNEIKFMNFILIHIQYTFIGHNELEQLLKYLYFL
jgi:hypothetical protein